jgi:hypothetical protein
LAAAAIAQQPAPAPMPGAPPQIQQKQIRPEAPTNIQPKISQRNLLPSDIRPSVSTQTAGAQPKVTTFFNPDSGQIQQLVFPQQGGKIRQKLGPRAPGPGRPAKSDEFQQKMPQVDPQHQQQQQQQQQMQPSPQHQQQIVFNK